MFYHLCLLDLVIAVFTLLITSNATTICQPGDCLSKERILSPGIGFDLTLEYATAAVRYRNGTITTIARIEGDGEYKSFMLRSLTRCSAQPEGSDQVADGSCSEDSASTEIDRSKVLSLPIHSDGRDAVVQDQLLPLSSRLAGYCQNMIVDFFRHFVQQTRSKPRLDVSRLDPLTPDQTAVMRMIHQLQSQTELQEGHSISYVLVSTPSSFDEHQTSILLKALDSLELVAVPVTATAPRAGVVASGIGLCRYYRRLESCYEDIGGRPPENVLVIEYSKAMLGLTFLKVYQGLRTEQTPPMTWLHLGARSREMPGHLEQAQAYWSEVEAKIVEPLEMTQQLPTKLILMGESASNADFRGHVRDALTKLKIGGEGNPTEAVARLSEDEVHGLFQGSSWDVVSAGARGAAELGKRWMETMLGCRERHECSVERGIEETVEPEVPSSDNYFNVDKSRIYSVLRKQAG